MTRKTNKFEKNIEKVSEEKPNKIKKTKNIRTIGLTLGGVSAALAGAGAGIGAGHAIWKKEQKKDVVLSLQSVKDVISEIKMPKLVAGYEVTYYEKINQIKKNTFEEFAKKKAELNKDSSLTSKEKDLILSRWVLSQLDLIKAAIEKYVSSGEFVDTLGVKLPDGKFGILFETSKGDIYATGKDSGLLVLKKIQLNSLMFLKLK